MFISKKKYNDLGIKLAGLEISLKDAQDSIKQKDELIETLKKPLDFEYGPNKPTLLVKLGDHAKGWIPSQVHWLTVQKQLKAAELDKKYNIIWFNYAIHLEEPLNKE